MLGQFAIRAILLFTCTVGYSQPVQAVNQEERLIQELFLKNPELAEANRIVRPSDGTVHIDTGYNLVSITGFDELAGYISAQFWETAIWVDPRLAWNESEYPGVKDIKVPSKYIWLPDITFYSIGSKEMESGVPEEKAVIGSSGLVYFVPKRILNIKCDMDMENFPVDSQICKASHGSWVHNGKEINLTSSRAGLDNYAYHRDWDLINFNITQQTKYYSCCPEPYQTLEMTLEVKRKPSFYFCIFVAPMIALYFILPTIHLLPPACSQKTTIAGLMLLCTFLLHLLLYQQISGFAEEKTPKLVRRYQSLMAMLVISIGVSSLTAMLASTSHSVRRVPSAIRRVMNSILGRLCCFGASRGDFTLLYQNNNTLRDPEHDMTPIVDDGSEEQTSEASHTSSALHRLIDELKHARERRQLEMEWYQLAIFVDRLTCVAYLLYLIIGIIVAEAR